MNVLYFTLEDFESIENNHSINTDLLREFKRHGHNVFAVSPTERRKNLPTRLLFEEKTSENNGNKRSGGRSVILKPRIGNIQKTKSFIEKGISTVTIGWILKRAIKKYLSSDYLGVDVKFDLIIYCTPPITFLSAVEYVKKRDKARTYLLLRDIFPQNAVDLGMLRTTGLKGFLYKFFRRQEKRLYAISDRIGCMSQANVEYLLKYNPEIKTDQVEVCSNCIEVIDKSLDEKTRVAIRKRHALPLNKKIFVYGGNLGKPQGVPFIIECLRACVDLEDCYFLIVGDGTERHLLVDYVESERPKNVTLMKQLPKEEYEQLVAACDVGLIFLDHRFTIPNFPSRLLSYMSAKLPVLAATDKASDIGKAIVDGGFGWWCESDDSDKFLKAVLLCIEEMRKGQNVETEFQYLRTFYSSEVACQQIIAANLVDNCV